MTDCDHSRTYLQTRYADIDESVVTCPEACKDCDETVAEHIWRHSERIEQ